MRLRMSARIDGPLPAHVHDPEARAVVLEDAAALAALMVRAYRGTVDDAGEGPEEAATEVAKLFRGEFGPFNYDVSEVVTRGGVVVGATLVTEYEGCVMVAFSMTAPEWKRRGLARAGLSRVMARLQAAGESRVNLAVTRANVPAMRLYESMGFVEVPRSG